MTAQMLADYNPTSILKNAKKLTITQQEKEYWLNGPFG